MTANRSAARVVSIVCVVASITLFAYGMAFYYRDFPNKPQPELGRIYPLNNHGYFTFLTRREHLEREISIDTFLIPFGIAVLIDHFFDPFDRRSKGR